MELLQRKGKAADVCVQDWVSLEMFWQKELYDIFHDSFVIQKSALLQSVCVPPSEHSSPNKSEIRTMFWSHYWCINMYIWENAV